MSNDRAQRIKQMYAEALALQNAGDDQRAANIYGEIIKFNANIAEVHFQLTRLFLKHDKIQEALKHIKAATTLKPAEKDVWHLRHEVTKTLSDWSETQAFTKELETAPIEKRFKSDLKTAVAFKGKPKAFLRTIKQGDAIRVAQAISVRDFQAAEKLARSLIRTHPGEAVLFDYLGVSLASQDRPDEAERAFMEAIRADPTFAQARANYARLLNTMERHESVLKQCNLALRANPGYTDALFLRALAFDGLKQLDLAKADYQRVLRIDPKHERARIALGNVLYDKKEYLEVEGLLSEGIRMGIKNPALFLTLGGALIELNRSEEALVQFKAAREAAPDLSRPHVRIGEVLQTAGEFSEAEESFEKAIELDPDVGQYYRVYLTGKKVPVDSAIVQKMEKSFKDKSIDPASRANFGFALGKVMEDNKQYDRVFEFLHPANALMKESFPVDTDFRGQKIAELLGLYDAIDWKTHARNEANEFAPIFVTGMPRSGTTLVEQIIASHSTVTSAGEIGEANRLTAQLLGGDSPDVRDLTSIPLSEYENLATRYRKYIELLIPGSDRITDKSIQTFSYLGPIKLAMPKSKFIIVRRDPRDNLLSMYKNVFPQNTHNYAYNLRDLADFYHQFVETIDFWRERVPDWFYEIQYEDLVANPEEEARKLIAACGLEWEDACLSFHESGQRVRTLSVYQVRQPIYKSSAKSWERYAGELKELFDALGPEYSDAAQ